MIAIPLLITALSIAFLFIPFSRSSGDIAVDGLEALIQILLLFFGNIIMWIIYTTIF